VNLGKQKDPRVVLMVLRRGGDYLPEHVSILVDQVEEHWPSDRELVPVCLTDQPIDDPRVHEIPLLTGHSQGWWSKMQMFDPALGFGDLTILYMDLDTRIVGDLSEVASQDQLIALRDFYRRNGLGSGLMCLPQDPREEVWEAWRADPDAHIRTHRRGGDQRLLEALWLGRVEVGRWQEILPGQVVSFKKHVRGKGTPPDARVVCFHGRPRPWEAGW